MNEQIEGHHIPPSKRSAVSPGQYSSLMKERTQQLMNMVEMPSDPKLARKLRIKCLAACLLKDGVPFLESHRLR